MAGVRKFPCRKKETTEDGRLDFTGTSKGICDGFGTCQCSPPFLGEDCSMKDCKYNCSFNGICNVEYPVSRCLCRKGYFGEWCQFRECLNNCSYPNGVCNFLTGECSCSTIYSTYNRSRIWNVWKGEDCSFLIPWCSAYYNGYSRNLIIALLFVIVAVWIMVDP